MNRLCACVVLERTTVNMEEAVMQNNESEPSPVPWAAHDVWRGVIGLVLWWVVFILIAGLGQLLEWEINPGVFVGLAELVLLLPVWWLTVRKYRVGWDALGLREFKGAFIGLGCGLMILSFAFNAVYSSLLGLIDLQVQPDLAPVFAELGSPWWLLVAGVIVAPVVEEIFFRGFVFAGLRKRYHWRKAAVISSILFGLVHLEPAALIPIFILGYVFAYLYYRSNSIVPGILMHISTNALALGTAYLMAASDVST
jgi:membrane protease YdiL (CAAX protease family)